MLKGAEALALKELVPAVKDLVRLTRKSRLRGPLGRRAKSCRSWPRHGRPANGRNTYARIMKDYSLYKKCVFFIIAYHPIVSSLTEAK